MMPSGHRNHRFARLPAAVESLRLPPSLPPRDLAYMHYAPSPLSPESPAEISPDSVFTPPTTPQDLLPSRPPPIPAPTSGLFHPAPQHNTGAISLSMNFNAFSSYVAGAGPVGGPFPPSPIDPSSVASENKRAQNRRSAKRFREAQKIRWKALQDENAMLRLEVERLTCLVSRSAISEDEIPASQHRSDARAAAISISALVSPASNGPPMTPVMADGTQNTTSPQAPSAAHSPSLPGDIPSLHSHAAPPPPSHYGNQASSSVTSYPYPPSPADPAFSLEAEASLYAQILFSSSSRRPNCPYASELGLLLRCICVRSGVVLRGEPFSKDMCQAGPFALTAGLSPSNASALKRAISSSTPVALEYTRNGVPLNAIVGLSEEGGAGVIAEFKPINQVP